MILQLGYILHTVPAWKRVYNLRILVFVEYESEVEAERARVRALLDKLRIEAEVAVFWLASGQLATYETIIQGRTIDLAVEDAVNECLQDADWWDQLQEFRGRPRSMTGSQELASLASIVESTAGRPGIFNPHNGPEDYGERRRPSMVRLPELPKKPTVSTLARFGVNMGIHTQNLPPNVFDDSSDTDLNLESDDESSNSKSDLDADFNDVASAASEGDLEDFEPVRRPLLSDRRRSQGDTVIKRPTARRNISVETLSKSTEALNQSYGTMSSQTLPAGYSSEVNLGQSSSYNKSAVSLDKSPSRPSTPSKAQKRNTDSATQSTTQLAPTAQRPGFSRQSSYAKKFSSSLLPETMVTTSPEGTGPTIMFAETDAPRERPAMSRTNSAARFSSRPIPETKIRSEGDAGPTVSFAEPEYRERATSPSRRDEGADAQINIPELLENYNFKTAEDNASGSSYSSQGLPLSFNDLPSRAQYLILNELMRQNSSDAAVVFTTLPIPEEGTCDSEDASVRYLSDVEVLTHDLPPVLLVLSNNMTVTVSL